jgi:predicted dehydrogenase
MKRARFRLDLKRLRNASDIKVGLVGYGPSYGMGKIHLEEARQAGMTPVAVVARRPERQNAARADFPGIEVFSSLDKMLERSEANLVVIATPHHTHARLACRALRAGRHVLCEKPMALTTAECNAMMAAARKASRVLAVYHNRHWDRHIVNAVAHVRSGLIGKIVRIEARVGSRAKPADNWYSHEPEHGSITYCWGPHLIEYVLQLVDSEIVEVSGFAHRGFWSAQSKWGRACIEDEAALVVRFANGVWLSLVATAIDCNPRGSILDITGTRGSYVVNWACNELTRPVGGRIVRTRFENKPGPHWSQGRRLYENLAACLTRGTRLAVTPEWGRRIVHVLELGSRSARRGSALRASYS